jgi:hypothetical protein
MRTQAARVGLAALREWVLLAGRLPMQVTGSDRDVISRVGSTLFGDGRGGRGNPYPHQGGADGGDEQSVYPGVGRAHEVLPLIVNAAPDGLISEGVAHASEDSWNGLVLSGATSTINKPVRY